MHRVFISDLHLDAPTAPVFERFVDCLAGEAKYADEIYILGDLVEMWVGDDDDGATALALRKCLQSVTSQCPVFLMHGNRDFMFGPVFAEQTGVTLLEDPYLTDDGVLLSHGDLLCTDDAEYQAMRKMFRSAQWQAHTLSKSLDERKAFGQELRLQSLGTNANKPSNIMDVNSGATRALLEQHGTNQLIHGHTHRPGMHRTNDTRRIVLGAWQRCGWLCRQLDDRFSLECFPLARRYGSGTHRRG